MTAELEGELWCAGAPKLRTLQLEEVPPVAPGGHPPPKLQVHAFVTVNTREKRAKVYTSFQSESSVELPFRER